MNKLYICILAGCYLTTYPIAQTNFFDFERNIAMLETVYHDNIDQKANTSNTSNGDLIREITPFTYPFIKTVDAEQESILAAQSIQAIRQNLYKTALTEAVSEFPTSLQAKLTDTIQQLKTQLNKLLNIPLKTHGTAILTDIQENIFIRPAITQSTLTANLTSYAQRITSYLDDLKQNNVAIELLSTPFNHLKQLIIDENSLPRNNSFEQEVASIIPKRNAFIEKQLENAYRSLFEKKLHAFIFSTYDTQKDAQNYYQLKELIVLMPEEDDKKNFRDLLEAILPIRNTLIQGLEIIMHIQESLFEKGLEPALKAQINRVLTVKIKTILSSIKGKIQALPNETNTSLSAINWNNMKNKWISTIDKQANTLATTTPSINVIAENFLNTIFTLYLNPKVIASNIGLSNFTSKAKSEAVDITEEHLTDYKKSAINNKDTLNTDQKMAVYIKYRKYKYLRDILKKIIPNNDQFPTTALAQVLDIQRGGDIDEADWNAEDLAAIKALNAYIIEYFDPITNTFQGHCKNEFNKLFEDYINATIRRIKTQFNDSYAQWKVSANA